MEQDIKLKGQLRLYMQWPIIMTVVLAAVNVWIFRQDKKAGAVMLLFVAFYFAGAVFIYFYGRNTLLSDMVVGVFGNDYDTPDGTGVRDYIHVVDLAVGHVKALKKIQEKAGVCIYNLGTGVGYSVLDMVHAFEEASGKKVPYQIKERRAGDIASCYSDATKARKELGWTAERGLKEMCEDAWRWQSQNPNGYQTK